MLCSSYVFNTTNGTTGHCMPQYNIGDSCNATTDCYNYQNFGITCVNRICTAQSVGQVCGSILVNKTTIQYQCNNNLFCNTNTFPATCVEYQQEGDGCEFNTIPCAPNTQCMSDTNICENIMSRGQGANCDSTLNCKSGLACIGSNGFGQPPGVCVPAPSWNNATCNYTSTNITQCPTNTACSCFHSGLTSCYPVTQNLPCAQQYYNYLNCLYDNDCFWSISGSFLQAPVDNNTCSYQNCYIDTLLYYSCIQPTINLYFSDLCYYNPWQTLAEGFILTSLILGLIIAACVVICLLCCICIVGCILCSRRKKHDYQAL